MAPARVREAGEAGWREALAAAAVLPGAPVECPATRAKLAEVQARTSAVPLKVTAEALAMIMEQCRRAGAAGRRQ